MRTVKISAHEFFKTGLFVKKKLAMLVVACIFAVYAVNSFCVALTTLFTDPARAAMRTQYAYGVTEMTIEAGESCFEFKHGFVFYYKKFSERQLRALEEYAGDSLEINALYNDRQTATFQLSGDWFKDNKFLREMRYFRKNKENKIYRVAFFIRGDYTYIKTWSSLQIGVFFAEFESICIFISSFVAFIISAALFKRRRKALYGMVRDDGSVTTEAPEEVRKLVLLQSLFLTGVIYLIATFISHAMFLLINTIDLNDIYSLAFTYVPLTRHVIPEPLSALITLGLNALLVLTSVTPKKPKMKKAKRPEQNKATVEK